jgi:hypothetical protein
MLHDIAPVEEPLSSLVPLSVEVVTGKTRLNEFKSYIAQFHYLGYDRSVGESIRYFLHRRDG